LAAKLQLTTAEKWAIGRELCYLKRRLPNSLKLHNLPAIAARQERLTQIFKLVARLADFGAQKNNLDKIAIRDLRLAAGIFSRPTANVHCEKDDASFVERWLSQAKAVEAILTIQLIQHAGWRFLPITKRWSQGSSPQCSRKSSVASYRSRVRASASSSSVAVSGRSVSRSLGRRRSSRGCVPHAAQRRPQCENTERMTLLSH
jgi:hypothetical protein